MLTDLTSADWQSLTFVGERHRIGLRIAGPQSEAVARRLTHRLEDADFVIPGQIVADVALAGEPECCVDGSTALIIEGLTVEE